jgi:hypothetical protein
MPRFIVSKNESEESEKEQDLSFDKADKANAILGQFTDLIFDMWLENHKKE